MTKEKIPYTHQQLFDVGSPKVYTGRQLDEIAFPLGGIGTGTISLGGWGQLRDFEIFNRPSKGLQFNFSFFTLYAKRGDDEPVTRVLQGPVGGFFTGSGHGVDRATGAGLPHIRECKFTGEFPFARMDLGSSAIHCALPLEVSLEAFNPFIPLNNKDSSLPAAIFLIHLKNPSSEKVEATLFANLENKLGHPEVGKGVIAYKEGKNVSGLNMTTKKHASDSPRFGSMTLTTTWKNLNVQTCWFRGAWFDNLHRFWDAVSEKGELTENREPAEADDENTDIGSIGLKVSLEPGESVTLPIFITWYNPIFEKYWGEHATWKNYYATVFDDAFDVAEYIGANLERLESETRLFKDSLVASTLPSPVIDAISSQISILKSTTCLRLEDGTFYGWEGCNPSSGSCEGSCTHVWNYAQALPYLFPTLERSIRNADYAYNQQPDGHMTFRMPLPLSTKASGEFHAAADGQMGGVLKVYREWLVCGDDEWLRGLWPNVKLALEYAWKQWDADKDGVMENVQHNTYDIEFHGPNTMMGSFYLGALRAAEEMARYLGETEKADEYRKIFESGKTWMDEHLFNGEFYRHEVRTKEDGIITDPAKYPKYQYGDGCLSDQMIGQWYARMLGLGDLFDADNVKNTMASIFKYNWKSDLSEHANPQRIYALNDEAGLLLCSWPRGGRPPLPFVYSDEVWCGIEYQVAGHLIYEELIEEGLAIVKGVRDRHDGTRRNPWNEFECGSHYARSMANYSLLLALSGFSYAAPEQRIGFAPKIHEKGFDTLRTQPKDFACFFSVASGWGMYHQQFTDTGAKVTIEVRYGELTLRTINLAISAQTISADCAGQVISAEFENGESGTTITFATPVKISAGESLTITLN